MTDDLKLAFLAKTGDSDTQALVAEVYALRAELNSERKDYADLAKARDALVLVIAERDELREQLRRYAPSAGQRIRDLEAEVAKRDGYDTYDVTGVKALRDERDGYRNGNLDLHNENQALRVEAAKARDALVLVTIERDRWHEHSKHIGTELTDLHVIHKAMQDVVDEYRKATSDAPRYIRAEVDHGDDLDD